MGTTPNAAADPAAPTTKFQLGQVVDTKNGRGKITYVTPADKLGRLQKDASTGTMVMRPGPQTYHVDMGKGVSYDFDEPELTAVDPGAGAAKNAPAGAQLAAAS